MIKKVITAGILTSLAIISTVSRVKATVPYYYNPQPYTTNTYPGVSASFTGQTGGLQTIAAVNAFTLQYQTDHALEVAMAANQEAIVRQAQANQALLNSIAASQMIAGTLYPYAPIYTPTYTAPQPHCAPSVDPNKLQQARTAAAAARATANATLSRLNDAKAELNKLRSEIWLDPGLEQRLKDVQSLVWNLDMQYRDENNDACRKEAEAKRLENPCNYRLY